MVVRLAGLVVAAGALALGPVAHAQYSTDYNSCMSRAHNNTVQNGMCAQQELGKQDARLNKAYQALMAQYGADAGKKTELRDAERSWLKQRDYSCKVDRETIDDDCLMSKTAQRADELEKKLKF